MEVAVWENAAVGWEARICDGHQGSFHMEVVSVHQRLAASALSHGQVAHSWQPLEEFDFSRHPSFPSMQSVTGEVIPAGMRPGYGHVTTPDRKRGGKSDFCRKKCMQPYLDCCRLREIEPQRFTAISDAVAWLKRHREEVFVGSSIVIAGVVFITVSAGAGALGSCQPC